jgi:FkbM family methyltransferase
MLKFGLVHKNTVAKFNDGCKVYIDLTDPEPRNVYIKEEFERHFFPIASSFLTERGVFFDLGANVGFCTFGMLPERPRCEYHLFEANPHLVSLLNKSIELNNSHKIFVEHGCLSNQDGLSSFHIKEHQSGQSHVSYGDQKGLAVSNIVLDDYCKSMGVERVDFAKIDLEGFELSCLKGWSHFLSNGLVKAIYVEVIPENQHRYGLKTHDLLRFIESFGYNLYFCKEEDFGDSLKVNRARVKLNQGAHTLTVAPFVSQDYPQNLSTDVLACLL